MRTWCAVGVLAALLLLVGCRPVQPPQPPMAEFTYAPSPVHAGEEVVFDGSPSRAVQGEIVAYAWRFGDGVTAQGVRPAHVYAAEGTYVVTLVVTDDGGREGETEKTLEVLPEVVPPPPGGPRASFTAEPREGPAPLQVAFDASGSTGAIVAYRWEFGDAAAGTGVTVTHTYTDPGTYTARLTVEDEGGRTHSAARSITVRSPAGGPVQAAFTMDPNPVPVGQGVTFDASGSSGPIVSYSWAFGDGASGTGKVVQHTYAEPGAYPVRLTVRDAGGAAAEAEATLYVIPVFPPPP